MSVDKNKEIYDLIRFLKNPTAFHVTESVKARLESEGFNSLNHSKVELKDGEGYFIATEGTIIAFRLPRLSERDWITIRSLPLRLWSAHTDSPALKVKPRPIINKQHHVGIGIEVYGGAILNTWLDRPLGVAGRFFTVDKNGKSQIHTVNVSDPEMMVIIPNAAIHLNRNINKGFTLSPDIHLTALWSVSGIPASTNEEEWFSFLKEKSGIKGKILSHDLFLYDPQPPILLGKDQDFLNSPRLDNLAMIHAGLSGFLHAKKSTSTNLPYVSVLAFFNHEEIGSTTYEGAASGLLLKTIESFYEKLHTLAPQLNKNSWTLGEERSILISADMAHGFHPSYESCYEDNHRPILNGGPVIKYNTSFRYTTSGASAAFIKHLLQSTHPSLPVQEYLHHADIPCGSTIGPSISSRLAIPSVDIGNPLWAMHSIRETAGIKDHLMMIELAKRFFK